MTETERTAVLRKKLTTTIGDLGTALAKIGELQEEKDKMEVALEEISEAVSRGLNGASCQSIAIQALDKNN